MALCTVSHGYGGRLARGARGNGSGIGARGRGGGVGGGSRLRGETSARLPLSPRTLCAPGAGSRGVHGGNPTATVATGGIAEEGTGSQDEPMLHVERSVHAGTWICCVPCYWLRRSKAVHKALLTFAMLLVTSLLVTSPVLFLIATLPEGEQPRNCGLLVGAFIIIIRL